ncbi:MAG: ATP synthase F0 subunit B [Ruminococcaceae bacterium]|nr:ATP synthase F0 subunit B [Oscillospiraceae bacterium]
MKRVEELLNEIQGIMEDAKAVPLTGGKSLIDTEQILDIIDEIQDSLPSEVRQAKNIVADRSQIIAEAKREAEGIIREAEEKKKQMVNESEIVRAAHAQANEILNDVKAKTADMRRAASEFVEDVMKKTDEAITYQLTELRKTRQNIKMTQKTGTGTNNF